MLLKRLLREQKDKTQIDYAILEYSFPGKSVNIIKDEMDSIFNIKNY